MVRLYRNLSDRIEKRPAISADHKHAVGGVYECHSGSEQSRENHNGGEGHPARRLTCGNSEKTDFGRGIEAKTEQTSYWEHLPASRHHAEHGPENPGKKTATGQQQIEFLLVDGLPAPRPLKTLPDAAQYDEIDGGDS